MSVHGVARLDDLIAEIKALPRSRQDEAAAVLDLLLVQERHRPAFSDSQLEIFARRSEAPADVVPDDEMAAFFRGLGV